MLRAEGSEEEAQVGLVLPEDVRPSEAETMILPRTPDESFVVDVARGLDGRGIVHLIGRLNRERVGVLRAPPDCDFRSAPATPDGVCACLSRSFL